MSTLTHYKKVSRQDKAKHHPMSMNPNLRTVQQKQASKPYKSKNPEPEKISQRTRERTIQRRLT